jgi:hypothetical protein
MTLLQPIRNVTAGAPRTPAAPPIAIPWPKYQHGYAQLGRDLAPWEALVTAASRQQQAPSAARR